MNPKTELIWGLRVRPEIQNREPGSLRPWSSEDEATAAKVGYHSGPSSLAIGFLGFLSRVYKDYYNIGALRPP